MLRARKHLVVAVPHIEPGLELVLRWPSAEDCTQTQMAALTIEATLKQQGRQERASRAMAVRAEREGDALVKGLTEHGDPAAMAAALTRLAQNAKVMQEGIAQESVDLAATFCRLIVAQRQNGKQEPLRVVPTIDEAPDGDEGVIHVGQLGSLPALWHQVREVYLAQVVPFPAGASGAVG